MKISDMGNQIIILFSLRVSLHEALFHSSTSSTFQFSVHKATRCDNHADLLHSQTWTLRSAPWHCPSEWQELSVFCNRQKTITLQEFR